jgi:hypothetical protein
MGKLLMVCVLPGCLPGGSLSTRELRSEDKKSNAPDDESEKQAAIERREKLTKWMRSFAEETEIVEKRPGKSDPHAAQLVPIPVFRYSDIERNILDATLWVWTRHSRPLAFEKVEVSTAGGRKWTVCFASLSENLLSVEWPEDRRYAARTPGVKFSAIPKAEPPADKPRLRTGQLKALKDRFTGRLGVDAAGKGGAETRTMAKPIFAYADPDSMLPLGAIFGMSSTGTNPDLLLLIEARPDGDGALRWEYAHARMTSASLVMRLDDAEVWSEPVVSLRNPMYDNWAVLFLDRELE